MKLRFIPAGLALTVTLSGAVTEDLGQDLAYRRAVRLPAELPADYTPHPRSLVLDLRGAAGEPGAANILSAWLQFRPRPEMPLFVLVNAATDPLLLKALHSRPWSGVITLAPSSLIPAPDLPVATSAEDDAAACLALNRGTPATALLAVPIVKPRRDEAELNRPYATPTQGVPATTEGPSVEVAGAAIKSPDAATFTPPIPSDQTSATPAHQVDLVLARAVQLHRSLVALRRLPSTKG